MCGSLPFTNHNGYVDEFFNPETTVLTYSPGRWETVNQDIQNILRNEEQRLMRVREGQTRVLQSHTWDVRARELVDHLTPVLMSDHFNRGVSKREGA